MTTIDPSAASIVRGLVPLSGIDSICRLPRRSLGEGGLGVGPRVFIFRKRAAPAVGEIKDRHVKYEHRVVPWCARSKELAQPAPEIVFTLFGSHFDFRMSPTLTGL